jgi:hypothetical protein
MKTRIVMPDELVLTWNVYIPLLTQALDHGCGETKLAEYLRRLMALEAQLWAIETDAGTLQGVCLTQFLNYSTHKTVHIIGLAGVHFKEWAHLHKHVESFGIKAGAIAVEQWGRPGWAKVLPKLVPGYKPVYQVMRKELPQGVTRT